MDVNYFGLLRLAQEFGPAMRREGGRPVERHAGHLLSSIALHYPAHGTFSASKAAVFPLSNACVRDAAGRCGHQLFQARSMTSDQALPRRSLAGSLRKP